MPERQRVGAELRLLVVGPSCWAKATTEVGAVEKATEHLYGKRRPRIKSYLLYVVSLETRVDEMGGLCWPEGTVEPILVKAVKDGKEVDPSTI